MCYQFCNIRYKLIFFLLTFHLLLFLSLAIFSFFLFPISMNTEFSLNLCIASFGKGSWTIFICIKIGRGKRLLSGGCDPKKYVYFSLHSSQHNFLLKYREKCRELILKSSLFNKFYTCPSKSHWVDITHFFYLSIYIFYLLISPL